MSNNEFKELSSRKIKSLSKEEKIEYYKNLKEAYLQMPYNEDEKRKLDENYKKAGRVIIPVIDFLFHPKPINTEEKIEKIDGMGLIYVCNHLNSLDQFPIISAIGKDKPITVLVKDTLLKLKRGKLYKYVGCEFVNPNSMKSMSSAMEQLTKHILRGRDVLIFPEGTRNTGNQLMLDFKPGAVMIAQKTGTKIVPFAVNEDYKLGKNNHLYVRRGKAITVSIDEDLKDANAKLEEAVRSLIWDNMELERANRINELDASIREEAEKQFIKKRQKLEKQRQKIN